MLIHVMKTEVQNSSLKCLGLKFNVLITFGITIWWNVIHTLTYVVVEECILSNITKLKYSFDELMGWLDYGLIIGFEKGKDSS